MFLNFTPHNHHSSVFFFLSCFIFSLPVVLEPLNAGFITYNREKSEVTANLVILSLLCLCFPCPYGDRLASVDKAEHINWDGSIVTLKITLIQAELICYLDQSE